MKLTTTLLLFLLVPVSTASAVLFTVDRGTSDVSGTIPPADDILSPVLPSPPVLVGGSMANVDAFSFGTNVPDAPPAWEFSVDSGAIGLTGSAVAFQSGGISSGEQANDIYRGVPGSGTNTLVFDGNGLGIPTAPPLGLAEPSTSFLGVNGYDRASAPGSLIYWSVDALSLSTFPYSGAIPPATAADIFVSVSTSGYAGGVLTKFAPESALGLLPGDNIDALEIYDAGTPGVLDPMLDVIHFSLDPLSPSLTGSFSPGDIFVSSGAGTFGLAVPHFTIGLGGADNLNALSAIPESAILPWIALSLASGLFVLVKKLRSTSRVPAQAV